MGGMLRHTLKDGRSILVRDATVADSAALLDTELAVIDAGVGVVQAREDLPESVDAYRDKLQERLGDDNAARDLCYAVAERDGAVVGYGQIERFGPARVRHVASLFLGVHPAHQGQGIGRAIMRYLLDWARRVEPPIVRVELSVQVDNLRARKLYESLGFEAEGIRRRLVRTEDGREHDDCFMALLLDE